jgi:hypothetical protein
LKKIPIDFEKLYGLKKNYFVWNEREGGVQIGVSAQEIQKLYPEIVSIDDKGFLTVAYDKLSVVALAAIDELYIENINLKKRLSKLEELYGNK